jgi:hypothetical protein
LPPEAGLLPTDGAPHGIPLAAQAQNWLDDLARESASAAIAGLRAAQLLGERAALNGFAVPGMVSAGGGCRLYRAGGDYIALNLARPDDRELLPALFGDGGIDPNDDTAIARRIASGPAAPLVALGRELGLAIAHTGEDAPCPAVSVLATGAAFPPPCAAPLVLDLSGLWAGPLAGHLLWQAGARVVKLESPRRPDTMRGNEMGSGGDPALFARLNQGKASVSLDITTPDGRAALLALIARADIVIEAARPRALAQLGVDAGALVASRAEKPLVWLTITGHGASGPAAQWVGFGDDCGVAGGLTDALFAATGRVGFVGDAIADPLTGIRAACEGWRAWRAGTSCRIGLAMSGVVAEALAVERQHAPERLAGDLAAWASAMGRPFPAGPVRPVTAIVHPFGADTARWLGEQAPC